MHGNFLLNPCVEIKSGINGILRYLLSMKHTWILTFLLNMQHTWS